MSNPGDRFLIDPAALPEPRPNSWTNNGATVVPRPPGDLPDVPPGFAVDVFAEGLGQARWVEVAPNGDVLLARPNRGDVLLLRDADGDGRAETRVTLLSGLQQPQGMAVRPDALYVAATDAVYRVPWQVGALAPAGAPTAVTAPGALGPSTGHALRSLAFSADGGSFYVGIGSHGNLAVEPAPRASILQFNADGSGQRTLADGLRNPAGLEVDPSGQLWTTVVERDGMGDGLVPDFLTRVTPGGFYGWPYAYIGGHPQPEFAAQRPDLVAAAITPDVLFEAHSTPIGFTFYTGTQFPESHRGDAFVALRGSWNASTPHGFMVARVDLENGVPRNGYEVFMTGFEVGTGNRPEVYGRPTTVAQAADGSLLVGDDVGGTIYRVRWQPAAGPGPDQLVLGGGDDRIAGGAGNDTIEGGGGIDTAAFQGYGWQYSVLDTGAGLLVVDNVAGRDGTDTLTNVERLAFADGETAAAERFDALSYLASHADLQDAFGVSEAEARRHFLEHGRLEGRRTTFDPHEYAASYADLTAAFGADGRAAALHWLQHGRFEGRDPARFDAAAYTAANPDLRAAFGANERAGTLHYLTYGQGEGRAAAFAPEPVWSL